MSSTETWPSSSRIQSVAFGSRLSIHDACRRGTRTVIDAVEEALRGLGVKPLRREGEPEAGWWLLDYVDVVVHVFGEEERAYYDLERLWSDAPHVEWEASDAAATGR